MFPALQFNQHGLKNSKYSNLYQIFEYLNAVSFIFENKLIIFVAMINYKNKKV